MYGDGVVQEQELCMWLNRQKRLARNRRLPRDRREALAGLGCISSSHDSVWESHFRALKRFRDRHGHCAVPQQYPRNMKLARWVGNQRFALQRGAVSPARVERLVRLGFLNPAGGGAAGNGNGTGNNGTVTPRRGRPWNILTPARLLLLSTPESLPPGGPEIEMGGERGTRRQRRRLAPAGGGVDAGGGGAVATVYVGETRNSAAGADGPASGADGPASGPVAWPASGISDEPASGRTDGPASEREDGPASGAACGPASGQGAPALALPPALKKQMGHPGREALDALDALEDASIVPVGAAPPPLHPGLLREPPRVILRQARIGGGRDPGGGEEVRVEMVSAFLDYHQTPTS
ncbi:helicase associated domain-containing protein [Baffinella frigidus]|nr:helicase associated domain-containing protein [Cryptophyta sp. CCMP2293]